MENTKGFLGRAIAGAVVTILLLSTNISIVSAAITFSGTNISGDSSLSVDGASTISIGTSSALGVLIGHLGITTTFPGAVTITGTTTIQNLMVSGTTITQANAFNIGGNLNVTGTATFASALTQFGGAVSLASTTITGNATTTGNFAVLGSLVDANGNKYVTSTSAGITPTINGITSSTFNFLGAGGLSVSSSSNPNNITYTFTNPGFVTAASSVTWSSLQTFASTTIFSDIATSSLFYATSTGQLVPLLLGSNLSISGGTLNAAGGGGGSGNVNASGTFMLNAPIVGAGNGTTTLITATSPYTSGHSGGSAYENLINCRDDVVSYAEFQAPATASSVTLFTAPAYWKPISFTLEESTTFTSGTSTVTALSATIIGTSGTAFTTPFPLMGASNPPFADFDGDLFSTAANASAAQVVAVQVAVANLNPGNLTSLTAGSLTVRSCGMVLQ